MTDRDNDLMEHFLKNAVDIDRKLLRSSVSPEDFRELLREMESLRDVARGLGRWAHADPKKRRRELANMLAAYEVWNTLHEEARC